ncbi:MAG: sugar transferase [Deltaproteobacteria bacterium]|nr:sugar transferase [Deltaproteobacteria bacterium]
MLRERSAVVVQAHRVLDILLTVAAFVGAYLIKLHLLPYPWRGLITDPDYYVVLLMVVIIWYVMLYLFGLYDSYRRRTFPAIFWNMVEATATSAGLLILAMYLFKIEDVSRLLIALFVLLDVGLLTLSKGTVYWLLRHYRSKGFNFRNILIVGSRERAKDVIAAVQEDPGAGFSIVGCLETEPGEVGKDVADSVRVIGTVNFLEQLLRDHVVDDIVFAMPLRQIPEVDRYIAVAEKMGVGVRIVPDWQIHKIMYRPHIASMNFEEFLGVPTMALKTTPVKQKELLVKNAMDYIIAAVLIGVFSPLLLIIAALIKVSSKGPVFFTQERCGLNGRRFLLYKFRTMTADAESRRRELETANESDGPVFKIHKDPRIIPLVGTFLRKTGLDELPQLINVLKGEMSLVGPRPPIPSEVGEYDVWQRRRLSMKPGLTCLWQIAPQRNEISFEDWMKMDLRYIDNWSLGMDFRILIRTARAVLMGEGR